MKSYLWCNVFDCDLEELVRFSSVLENLRSDNSKREVWDLSISKKGFFIAKSFYYEEKH